MKKTIFSLVAVATLLSAEGMDNKNLFETKCATCHKVNVEDKSSLIAPPINKVMMHIKKSFKEKSEALAFMKDYVINPDPKKTICPSIDIFGVMPSQKGVISEKELEGILGYIYENFPKGMKKGMSKKWQGQGKCDTQGRCGGCGRGKGKGGRGFMRIDTDGDGSISKDEFNAFRAKKEGIDIKRIKYDYFFKKLDTNGDGKLDRGEFMNFRKMMRG